MTVKEYLSLGRSDEQDKEMVKEYNKELIEKYPWCIPPDRWDPLYVHPQGINPDYDYTWTMLDDMPDGWRIAFGEDFCADIQAIYETLPETTKQLFYPAQIKEKFGALRVYWNVAVDGMSDVIRKYEEKSHGICVNCGKPATLISTGWICPWCDDCAKEIHGELVPIKEWFKEGFKDEN